ncbi:MAG: adenylate/guanylate cyclase domain-containing protein [Gammaproteobacteria bacterium]|jgi:class 3 adenylate cyclase/predicted ATPase
MQCVSCGFENPDSMKFCGQCGSSLTPECPQCHFQNPPGFRYCGQCGHALQAPGNAPQSDTPHPTVADETPAIDALPPGKVHHHEAERRQLTVMFCDLVGSAALSEIVDPEDLREIIGEYRHTCQKVVDRFQGHIAQYLGDGILTYFGYPQANEDDATRAVEAGLHLIRNIQHLNERLHAERGVTLSLRIGIHTGLVVIGEISGDDKRSLALGTTPNVAARLQDLAETNTVLISDATYRLIHSRFQCSPIGEKQLKGFSHPFTLYQVESVADSSLPLVSETAFNQVPLIGREQESALILDRLEQARAGQGQVVVLSGEAGIGKSRLVQLLREVATEDDIQLFECWGSPYHKNSFLHCVMTVLHNVLELDQCNSNEEKVQKLEEPLGTFGVPLEESVPLLADLLSIALPEGRYADLQLTPQQRKQKILESLLGLVMGLGAERMVVIVLEDLHWVDPTTIELLEMLIDHVPTSNIFVLVSYRLDFTPPWTPRSHITHISINRLTRKQAGHMVRWICNNKQLPAQVFDEIINKTDGTPFFVEELTKMVLESDLLKESADAYELKGPISSLAIPSTLQDSLMARLDRLGAAKELAQLSATIGREFAHNILEAVTKDLYDDMDQQLSSLVFHELLYQRGFPPVASYTFRHALVHEVAYQSLLKKTRQKYHRKIAEVLATQFPEKIHENPEIMARHCNEAGDYESAARYWSRAGRLAIQRSANADATVHLTNALQALENLSDSPKKAETELQVQAALGLACMLLKGYAADEVQAAYGRAFELSRNTGKSSSTFPILCGLWEFYLVRAELDTAQDLAVQLQGIAAETANPGYFLEAQRTLGATAFWRGDLSSAEHYLNRGLATNIPDQPSDHMPIYGQDTRVATLASAACVSWLTGNPDRALEQINLAQERAGKLKHPFSIVYATYFASIIHQLRGDTDKTLKLTQQTITLSQQYEFTFWLEITCMINLWAKYELTGDEEHIKAFGTKLAQYTKVGSRLALSYLQSLFIRMHIKGGSLAQAEIVVNQAIDELSTHPEQFFRAEIYRLKALISAKQQTLPYSETESYFLDALDFAQQQNALGLALRGTVDYCRFLHAHDQSARAQQHLSGIMEKFGEGRDTSDYLAANQLLQQISGETPVERPVQETSRPQPEAI